MNNSLLPTAHLTPETLGAMIRLYIEDLPSAEDFCPYPSDWGDCPIMDAYEEIQSGKASLEAILFDFRDVHEMFS